MRNFNIRFVSQENAVRNIATDEKIVAQEIAAALRFAGFKEVKIFQGLKEIPSSFEIMTSWGTQSFVPIKQTQ